MAQRFRVECINKREHNNPHERILFIGGVGTDNVRWKRSQPQAIIDIESKAREYYVHVGSYTIDVEVALHSGNKYIKTKPDSTGKDNLLSLPECPP